jgi:hypothetical protein
MVMPMIVILVPILFAAVPVTCEAFPSIDEAGPKSVRRDLTHFELRWQIKVTDIAYYEDGGSTGFTIVDADEKQIQCFFHANMDGDSPGLLYLGGRVPSDENSRPVPLCGIDKMSVIRLAEAYLNTVLTAEEQKELLEARSVHDIEKKNDDYRRLLVMLDYRNSLCHELLKTDS